MNFLQTLKYLRDDPNRFGGTTNEWTEAGRWNAVCTVINEAENGKNTWTTIEIDSLLREADQY